MAFRLKSHASIADELHRIVRKELRDALDGLAVRKPDEEAIHEARKSVKKVRAVVRLLHDALGSDYRTQNDLLRATAHKLAPLRDADATSETIQALHSRYSAVVTRSIVQRVLRGLGSRKRQIHRRAGGRVLQAAAGLRRVQNTLPHRLQRVAGFRTVRTGLTRGYRRAAKALNPLGVASDATQLHAWRRRVKDHLYQVRLFEGLHPAFRARSKQLRELEEWLGNDHNQALLRALLVASPERFGDARSIAIVLGCITKHQAWLRGRALRRGRRLFTLKPDAFSSSVTNWWPARSKKRGK